MLRVFLALNLLFLSLYACKGGYESCKLKTSNLNVIQNQNLVIPLKNNQTLIYSTSLVNAKIIKYDPFLNLYLIKSKKYVHFPFRINNKLSLGQASIDANMAIEGRLKKSQIGLNSLASYSEVVSAPALLLSSCCNLEGLVTQKGIIQKEYIYNFIHSKNLHYGDLGIRVVDEGKYIVVKRVNPFDIDNLFKKDDCITHVNGKKVQNASRLMMDILFSKVGTKLDLTIVRDAKKIHIKTEVSQRYGGGAISDTFLEQNGLYFSQNLTILSVGKMYKKYGLDIGDKLIQVNGKKVSSIEDIRENIDSFKHFASLLFLRNNFQFFININP